jgi:hypothetical protein
MNLKSAQKAGNENGGQSCPGKCRKPLLLRKRHPWMTRRRMKIQFIQYTGALSQDCERKVTRDSAHLYFSAPRSTRIVSLGTNVQYCHGSALNLVDKLAADAITSIKFDVDNDGQSWLMTSWLHNVLPGISQLSWTWMAWHVSCILCSSQGESMCCNTAIWKNT